LNPITELKEIVGSQKTVSTSRLEPMVRKLEKIMIKQQQHANSQSKRLRDMNDQLQRVRSKSDKRKAMVEDYENLKLHHRNLTREYNLLLEKHQSYKRE
jgi:hypothetical protein